MHPMFKNSHRFAAKEWIGMNMRGTLASPALTGLLAVLLLGVGVCYLWAESRVSELQDQLELVTLLQERAEQTVTKLEDEAQGLKSRSLDDQSKVKQTSNDLSICQSNLQSNIDEMNKQKEQVAELDKLKEHSTALEAEKKKVEADLDAAKKDCGAQITNIQQENVQCQKQKTDMQADYEERIKQLTIKKIEVKEADKGIVTSTLHVFAEDVSTMRG
ncbi:unnamed protein product [Lampetra fluviatilis]